MPNDPNYPQAAPYVDGAPAQQGGYDNTSYYDNRSTAPVGNGYDERQDADDQKILDDAMGKGAEVVAGAVILDGKGLGFMEFGKFKPSPGGRNWAKAQEQGADVSAEPTPISSEYDPADHEGPAIEAKMQVEKVNATNKAIADANALSDAERALIEADAAVGTKTAGKKKVGATDSTGPTSTAPTSA